MEETREPDACIELRRKWDREEDIRIDLWGWSTSTETSKRRQVFRKTAHRARLDDVLLHFDNLRATSKRMKNVWTYRLDTSRSFLCLARKTRIRPRDNVSIASIGRTLLEIVEFLCLNSNRVSCSTKRKKKKKKRKKNAIVRNRERDGKRRKQRTGRA